jgi:glycosyltransferase involved in cell wall biosynthesis
MNKILKVMVINILKFAHHKQNIAVIFQNDEDKGIFLDNKIIDENHAYKIKGSGVDLSVFSYVPEPEDTIIRVLFTARMLRNKGVIELAEAANSLKEKYQNRIQFLLAGDVDNNPKSLTPEEMKAISDGEYIKWLGHRADICELLKQSHIFAFPSYYREGVPKSLIEACAAGRPIITTDSVGCRDCVIDGYNGFLIPIKDRETLAEKLEILINDRQLRICMGQNSRKLAERDFSVDHVVKAHLAIYNKLLEIKRQEN